MTPLWTGAELATATAGRFPGEAPASITGISIDSRTLAPGDLFVALVGDSDGHDHVQAALDKGAGAVLVHRDDVSDPRALHVADTFDALHALGRAGRDRYLGQVVAVTGSVGKTTTKEMLRTALSALGRTHAAQASHNNHWGVPLTLARLPADAAFCVVEIGMNHSGEIAPLAALARPHVAIVTTIAASHIGHMGSLQAIAREKAALFGALCPGGTAIFPADAAHADLLRDAAPGPTLRIGEDVRIGALSLGPDGSVFEVVLPEAMPGALSTAPLGVRLSAPGRHMIGNALSCLAAVAALGGDLPTAARALTGFMPGDGRGALRPILDGRASLLDESYNASGASVRASLDVLRLLPAERRIAVLGDMLELGTFAQSEHENLDQSVRDAADLVYCSGAMMKYLYDGLPETMRGAHADSAKALAPIVRDALRAGDVVLVKGSYGSRMRDVVQALTAASIVDAA